MKSWAPEVIYVMWGMSACGAAGAVEDDMSIRARRRPLPRAHRRGRVARGRRAVQRDRRRADPSLRSGDPGDRRIPPLRQSREWPGPWPRRRASRRQEGGRRLVEFTPDGRWSRSMRCSTASTTTSPVISWSTAGPSLVRRSAPCDDPFRPRDLSLSRPRLGAPPGAQRPPRMGGDAPRRFPRGAVVAGRETLYVADGDRVRTSGGSYALAVAADGARSPRCCRSARTSRRARGIEAVLDAAGTRRCGGWELRGPGPLICVLAAGAVIESHLFPPTAHRCCFGGGDLDTLS